MGWRMGMTLDKVGAGNERSDQRQNKDREVGPTAGELPMIENSS